MKFRASIAFSNPYFWFISLFFFSQIIAALMFILLLVWITQYQQGFVSWNNLKVFNYHPLCMSFGMVFLYGNAIVLFRLLSMCKKICVKIAHALIQVLVLVLVIVGLLTVMQSHKIGKYEDFWSIHSWVGIVTIALFLMQWIVGFVSFLYPKLKEGSRATYLVYHKFFGLAIFVYGCASCLTGLSETSIFDVKGHDKLPADQIILNIFGLSVVVYGTIVVFLTTKSDFTREETVAVPN